MTNRTTRASTFAAIAAVGALSATLAACSSGTTATTEPAAPAATETAAPATSVAAPAAVTISIITKDSTNPFFVAMQEGAKAAAVSAGVDLTVGSGKAEDDDAGQIALIENAIAQGQAGILITPISVNVNEAINMARDAGLYVIALDTPTDPPDVVDITFATDNCLAGEAIGQWTAGKLNGEKAIIARLVNFKDRMVPVDYCRDNGFLKGLGVDIVDPTITGDEPSSGKYTTGPGGDYEIACLEAMGADEEGGRKGMETCLSKNPDINVVYAINEQVAFGADAALKAAGKTVGKGVFVVSADGGLAAAEAVKAGNIQATSQPDPMRMGSLGVEAIKAFADGEAPPEKTSANGEFFDTGVTLCTEDPQDTVTSAYQENAQYCIDSARG